MNSIPLAEPAELLAGKMLAGAISARMTVDGAQVINFSGCTYLALANLPQLRAAAREAVDNGHAFAMQLHTAYGVSEPGFTAVEQAAADYCDTEAAVYFPSGYLIGMVGLSALDDLAGPIFIDEAAHFSLWDAARLSRRDVHPFAHCDADALQAAVRSRLKAGERPIVITDGAFATSGQVPPLSAYAAIVRPLEGRVLIDEAHSFGVIGANGRGAAEYCGIEDVALGVGTLSKAFCAQGAVLACNRSVADRVRKMPPLRGANAGSPISAEVGAAALRYMAGHPERRDHLHRLTARLRRGLRELGYGIIDTPAPIVSFKAGSNADMRALQSRLFEREVYVLLSNYLGAGPDGVLRAAVYADHSEDDIDLLIGLVRELG